MVQPVSLGSPLQLDQRRVADRFDDVLVDGHVQKSAGLLPNLGNDPRSDRRSGSRFCADKRRGRHFGFGEHHLAHVDISRQESGLAISEVVFPQPPEPVVEAERHQIRPGRAEIISPDRKRLGIILPENAFADDGNAEPLAERFQHLRRGQHAARENVALDEIDLAPIGLEQAVLDGDGLNAGEAAGQQPVAQLRKISRPELLADRLDHLDRGDPVIAGRARRGSPAAGSRPCRQGRPPGCARCAKSRCSLLMVRPTTLAP